MGLCGWRGSRGSSVVERFATRGTDLIAGTDFSATGRAVQDQFHATRRAHGIVLGDNPATFRAERLITVGAAILVWLQRGVADRAGMAEVEAAFGAASHLCGQLCATLGAAELELGATGGAHGVVLCHRRTTGGAEWLATTGTVGQAHSHIGTAGGTGPGGVKATVGAVDLLVLQEQEALGAHPLPTFGTGAQFATKLGCAHRALEQHQVRLSEKDGGRWAPFKLNPLPTLGTGQGCIQDARIAGRASTHKENAALWADLGAGRHWKATPWTGECEL
jgi:hypothetical protein